MRSTRNGSALVSDVVGVFVAGLRGAPVQFGGLGLLRELLAQRLVDLLHVDGEQPRHDAVINHVPDQLAQLRLGADRGRQLVEGHGVEVQVGAQLVELQRLVVDRRAPGSSFITSSRAVSGFIATRKSISFLRAM